MPLAGSSSLKEKRQLAYKQGIDNAFNSLPQSVKNQVGGLSDYVKYKAYSNKISSGASGSLEDFLKNSVDNALQNPQDTANNAIKYYASALGAVKGAYLDPTVIRYEDRDKTFENNILNVLNYAKDNNLSYVDLYNEASNSFNSAYEQSGQRSLSYVAQRSADNSSFGDFLKTAVMMVAPFALPGIGSAIGSALGATGTAATVIGNAVIGGTLAEASGGDFLEGALTAGAGSALSGIVAPELAAATGSNAIGQALTSGAMAELQGGDFLQGAIQGGISGGINDAKLAAQQEAFDNAMTESGLAGQTSVSPSELIGNVIPSTPDYSFVPDYSIPLPVASVIPEMAAQGIQVPTINEVVDVLAGPVDYSLPIPSTNIGLDIPSVLGDPTSFINQPAPDSGVTISDNVPTYQEDISGKLAALDLAKALAPIAIGAITAGSVVDAISGDSEPSGYPMLPIPTDWKTPEYNQAFTPSAPINFGDKELLAGTQWANPSLSSVINTLNYQPVPYNQPTYFQPQSQGASGIDSIIGNLDGKQISLADIISGIQSQYGQKTAS